MDSDPDTFKGKASVVNRTHGDATSAAARGTNSDTEIEEDTATVVLWTNVRELETLKHDFTNHCNAAERGARIYDSGSESSQKSAPGMDCGGGDADVEEWVTFRENVRALCQDNAMLRFEVKFLCVLWVCVFLCVYLFLCVCMCVCVCVLY
jgi:hypothetical protein